MSKRKRKPVAHAAVIHASLQIALEQASAAAAAITPRETTSYRPESL